jgi:hypothetical protein
MAAQPSAASRRAGTCISAPGAERLAAKERLAANKTGPEGPWLLVFDYGLIEQEFGQIATDVPQGFIAGESLYALSNDTLVQ